MPPPPEPSAPAGARRGWRQLRELKRGGLPEHDGWARGSGPGKRKPTLMRTHLLGTERYGFVSAHSYIPTGTGAESRR